MKNIIGLTALALAVGVSSAANASVIIFDGNNGGTAKTGTVEKATGTNLGTDVQGDPLDFSDFSVTAGFSTQTNLANASFSMAEINGSSTAYQDITPNHGGLGAFSGQADDAFKDDTDNLESNLITNSTGDEVLFFAFDSAVILEQVWFNGDHTETVAFSDNGGFDSGDTLFNIFFSEDGNLYQSVFGNSGLTQQAPTDQEYLMTGLASGYSYFAIAASGWNAAPGGYVEAIKYTSVPEPGTLALLGLGLAGLGFSRRRKAA